MEGVLIECDCVHVEEVKAQRLGVGNHIKMLSPIRDCAGVKPSSTTESAAVTVPTHTKQV